jgi:hypothetical protein
MIWKDKQTVERKEFPACLSIPKYGSQLLSSNLFAPTPARTTTTATTPKPTTTTTTMTTTAELVAAIMAAIDDFASASDDRERRRHRRALVRLVEELEARANDAARQLEERGAWHQVLLSRLRVERLVSGVNWRHLS